MVASFKTIFYVKSNVPLVPKRMWACLPDCRNACGLAYLIAEALSATITEVRLILRMDAGYVNPEKKTK